MIRQTLLALALAGACLGAALAKPVETLTTDAISLEPTADQVQAAVWAARFLEKFHYAAVPLDDNMSREIFDGFIESLDGDKWFLLRSDIEAFSKAREKLDDAIRDRELEVPFKIYNVYAERVKERSAHAQALIDKGFDFSVDETYEFDRENADYAASEAELADLWRKRVKNDWLRLKLAGKTEKEIRKTLTTRYGNYARRVAEINSEDVFQIFMNAYATSIEPHTNYLGPRASENFQISMRLSLEGIGAVLQRDGEYTAIRSIVPGGPAAMDGKLREGDRVVAVGQGDKGPMTDVVGWRLDDVVDLIRGPKDSVVRLDVLPADAGPDTPSQPLKLVRQKVKLEEQAAKKRVIEFGQAGQTRRIGVIELPTFYLDFDARRRGEPDYRSSTRDVAKLLGELKEAKVEGVIIDLRNNGGGSLAEATELTGLFIDQGPVVQVRGKTDLNVESDPNPGTLYDGPLAVLVNRASASASEIFAAAIQDYGRGLIVGERTFGKGTVQNLVDLDQFTNNETPKYGQLKLTMAQFFRVDGGSTQHKGVEPDIAFPQLTDPEDYGESALDHALPWTRIEPAKFRRVGDLGELIPVLAAKYEERSRQNPEFKFLREDLELYRKNRDQTEVSLLESARIKERDEDEARRQQRKKAREALGAAQAAAIAEASTDDGLEIDERSVAEQAEAERKAEDKPDVLLDETARILADAVMLLESHSTAQAETVKRRAGSALN